MTMQSKHNVPQVLVWVLPLMLAGCGLAPSNDTNLTRTRLGSFVVHACQDEGGSYDASNHVLATMDGNFCIYFPTEPKAIPERFSFKRGSDTITRYDRHAVRCILPGATLDLMASERPDGDVRTTVSGDYRAAINKACTEAAREFGFDEGATRHPIRMLKNNAIEGIEAEGKFNSGSDVFRMQIFGDRYGHLYRLIAAGAPDKMHGIEANEFFDSLDTSAETLAHAYKGVRPPEHKKSVETARANQSVPTLKTYITSDGKVLSDPTFGHGGGGVLVDPMNGSVYMSPAGGNVYFRSGR